MTRALRLYAATCLACSLATCGYLMGSAYVQAARASVVAEVSR